MLGNQVFCTNCNHQQNALNAQSNWLVCTACQHLFSPNDPKFKLKISTFRAQQSELLKLGDEYTCEKGTYILTGKIVKQEKQDEFAFWTEYCFTNAQNENLFLSEYNGHWNQIEETETFDFLKDKAANTFINANKKTVYIENDDYYLYHHYTLQIEYVEGEFTFNPFEDNGIDKVSAFAGLHYFASRKGKGANCEENAVLTWANGNGHLAELLAETLLPNIQTGQLVRKIEITENACKTTIYDTKTDKYYVIESAKIILAIPFFVRKKLLVNIEKTVFSLPITHQPWLVSNITLKNFTDKHGLPLAWDNVLMNSETLGFVFAQHQSLKTKHEQLVFTLYKPLDKGEAREIRKQYYAKTEKELEAEIIADLQAFYPNIAEQITAIDCHIWGHGMVSPSIDFLLNEKKKDLRQPIASKIFFAHTDYSGISIFEEAFWQGKKAVEELNNR